MSEEIINVLDHIGQQMGVAIDWTNQNVMPQITDVLGRYAEYEILKSGIIITINVLILTISIILSIIVIRAFNQTFNDDVSNAFFYSSSYGGMEPRGVGSVTIFVIIMLITLSVSILYFTVPNLISWIYIPEIQLLREFGVMLP